MPKSGWKDHQTGLRDGSLLAPVVNAYQAMRGVAFLTAVTFVVEIGDSRYHLFDVRSWNRGQWGTLASAL